MAGRVRLSLDGPGGSLHGRSLARIRNLANAVMATRTAPTATPYPIPAPRLALTAAVAAAGRGLQTTVVAGNETGDTVDGGGLGGDLEANPAGGEAAAVRPTSVALVVGAGDSTGGAIARAFAKEGYTVAVARRNKDKLADLVAEIAAEGGKAIPFGMDARKV